MLPKGEVAQERESVARQSYQLLSRWVKLTCLELLLLELNQVLHSIPIEHLAMNGESIVSSSTLLVTVFVPDHPWRDGQRGKVLRIIVALMSTSTSTPDEAYNRSVKDWWTIVSH